MGLFANIIGGKSQREGMAAYETQLLNAMNQLRQGRERYQQSMMPFTGAGTDSLLSLKRTAASDQPSDLYKFQLKDLLQSYERAASSGGLMGSTSYLNTVGEGSRRLGAEEEMRMIALRQYLANMGLGATQGVGSTSLDIDKLLAEMTIKRGENAMQKAAIPSTFQSVVGGLEGSLADIGGLMGFRNLFAPRTPSVSSMPAGVNNDFSSGISGQAWTPYIGGMTDDTSSLMQSLAGFGGDIPF